MSQTLKNEIKERKNMLFEITMSEVIDTFRITRATVNQASLGKKTNYTNRLTKDTRFEFEAIKIADISKQKMQIFRNVFPCLVNHSQLWNSFQKLKY